ncbi:hypothetical protein [Pseudomonas cichorii]|uniref:hypothetical protein n=1 Tax=Pseudomonas cichorii TaxID=36746 RepID=UPI001C8A4FBD|nr:hypothetical protein [Pseudomonas cichorii]MBX8513427.1 hypothetical protein [Pseudomonas cichorii]MBX8574486.1 hypothetical protein [Pseudomonas cichorii]
MKATYYLALASFIVLSFTAPETEWLVSFESLGLSESIDIYKGLFVLCLVLYIPMMVLVLCYLVSALVTFIRSKSFQGGFSLLIAPVAGVVALYRFDKWVFSEIF